MATVLFSRRVQLIVACRIRDGFAPLYPSKIRNSRPDTHDPAPDFASLHPGYQPRHPKPSRPLPVVVDRQHLAADRLGGVGGEEHREGCDVFGSIIALIDGSAIAAASTSSIDLPLIWARPAKTRSMRSPSTAPGAIALARPPPPKRPSMSSARWR